MLVERHLGAPRLGQDAIDADGMKAVAVEELEGRIEQMIASGYRHNRGSVIQYLYKSVYKLRAM
jgi:hypothetical protein